MVSEKILKNSVHQFVSSFSPRDAVGNIILSIRNVLRDAGYESTIYAETIHDEMKNEAEHHTKFDKKNSNAIVIYHHAFASNLVDFLLPLQNQMILVYHNITPPQFFSSLDKDTIAGCIRGREQLDQLKEKVQVGLCFSRYSEQELVQKGFKQTMVIPAVVSLTKKDSTKNISLENNFEDYVNIISVGRIVPHKKVEDILKTFAFYNQCVNNKSQLFLIGKYKESDKYYQWLLSIIKKLNLQNVNFLKDISDEELTSYYKIADIYLSMS